MNVYDFIVSHVGVSAFDALLLAIMFFLARSRYVEISASLTSHHQRLNRIERSVAAAGIPLHDLEDS